MATYTITLPDSFIVSSRGVDYKIRTDLFPADMVVRGAIHGFTQKIADSLADKAKVEGREQEVVDAVCAAIEVGDWSRRREGGAGLSELDTEILRIARGAVQVAFMKKYGVKAVKNLTDEQEKTIDRLAGEYAERKADEYRPLAEASIAAKRAAKAVEVDIEV